MQAKLRSQYPQRQVHMNRIEARVEFCFKGQYLKPSSIINLDESMRGHDPVEYIFRIIAADNGIGNYSHEFDVMIMEELTFDHPTGLAVDHLSDGRFDLDAFREAWLQQNTIRVLQPIAKTHMGITDLDEHPQLKAALIAAYQAK